MISRNLIYIYGDLTKNQTYCPAGVFLFWNSDIICHATRAGRAVVRSGLARVVVVREEKKTTIVRSNARRERSGRLPLLLRFGETATSAFASGRPGGRVHTSDKTVFLGVPFRSGMTTCTSWAQYSNLRSDTYYVRLFRASVRRSILVHSVLVAQGDWPLLAADRGEVSRDAPPPHRLLVSVVVVDF
jgi:hypothetical protein